MSPVYILLYLYPWWYNEGWFMLYSEFSRFLKLLSYSLIVSSLLADPFFSISVFGSVMCFCKLRHIIFDNYSIIASPLDVVCSHNLVHAQARNWILKATRWKPEPMWDIQYKNLPKIVWGSCRTYTISIITTWHPSYDNVTKDMPFSPGCAVWGSDTDGQIFGFIIYWSSIGNVKYGPAWHVLAKSSLRLEIVRKYLHGPCTCCNHHIVWEDA